MKIDIKPIIERASDRHDLIITTRGIECLYSIRYANGKECSVDFDPKSLDEFLPSRTVSSVLKGFEKGDIDKLKVVQKAVTTNKHPYLRNIIEELVPHDYIPGRMVLTTRYGHYKKLDSYQRKHFESELKRLTELSGKYQFVKIII